MSVRRFLPAAIAAGLVCSVAVVASPAAPVDAVAATPGDYVVTFDPGVDAAAKARKERALGNQVTDVFSDAVEGFVAELDANDVRRLRNDGDVLAVEPNSTVRVAATPGRYIVQLRSGASAFGVASAIGATNVTTYRQAITGFAADLTSEAYDALLADPNVITIEPDFLVETSDTQANPISWGLDRIDQRYRPLDRSFTYGARGAGVKAYVVDTGVRPTHVQFAGRVVAGFDGLRDGNGTNDCNGHGTHVAGTIAGVTAGVAKAATVVPVRVLGCNGSGWMSTVIAGIDWVVADHQAGQPAVANLSLGGAKSRIMNAAIARGVADGVVFVVAAGNSNIDACNASPASEPLAITVGASSSTDARASFSNWGTCVDLFAPGVGITSSTWSTDTALRSLSGTSMAAPHVAGAAALLLEADPALTPAQVAARINAAATPNVLTSIGTGSPNRLLFTGSPDTPTTTTSSTSSTSSTVAPTTTSVVTTTTAPTTTAPTTTSTTSTVAPTTTAPTTTAPTTTAPTTTIPRPLNDNFVSAVGLAGMTGALEGSTLYATREQYEPSHGGAGGSASIWYRWIAPADGDLTVATGSVAGSAFSSNFDTLLGVYTGTSVAGLALRAANDDFSASTGQLWSRVVLPVTAGTAYHIAVDGWGGAKGLVKLSWSFTAIDTSIKPSEPRSVTVSELDSAVYVSWLAPTTVGRGTLSYTATVQPGGQSCTTAGLRCLVGGLVNGNTYSVTVTARNDAGVGPASNPPVEFTPNTASGRPVATRAWGLDRIDQRALPLNGTISRSATGRAVSVYVIDTGVYASHNEFATRVTTGRNTIEGAPNPADTSDCNGHGTHVAGTAAGRTFGVAPDATIVPVKVLDCYGSGTLAGVIAGIDWMVAHHQAGVPAVANLSLGGSASIALNQAVARAVADGITVVVAAGNSAQDACTASPASEPSAITVGATDRYDRRASYSNFGTCVDVFAPGSGVLSAGISGTTSESTLSGTSMASPHVAGAAALLLETAPSLSPADVTRLVLASATGAVITDRGAGSPDAFLYIGPVQPATTPTTVAEPVTTTTAPAQTTTTVAATTPTTVAPATTTPQPVAEATTTTAAAAPTRIRTESMNIAGVTQPDATIVRANADRVLVRISNVSGPVDVLVNGKLFLKTKKRVVVLRSKGIAAKRVTVRASKSK